jgi:anti-anti-sigma factor
MSVSSETRSARDGSWVGVAWSGEIDMTNAPAFESDTLSVMRNTDAGLTIDLTDVGYIDSAGIRSLLSIRRLLAERQQRLLLVLPETSLLNRALEVAGVPALVPIHRSPAAARAAH